MLVRQLNRQWNLIQKILSGLSEKDKRAVANVLETVKCECLGYLNPEVDMAEITKNSVTRPARLPSTYARTFKGLVASGHVPERKAGKKRSTVRRGQPTFFVLFGVKQILPTIFIGTLVGPRN